MSELHISPSLALPADAITSTFGILAVRGAGKSYAAMVLAEEMAGAGLPFVVVDPVGNWYGLRSSADGKGPGISIPVFGGRHGDVPLERGAGQLIADLVVEQRMSCILDLSEFSEGDKIRFLIDFAERLYRKNTEPLHLFLEEADDYIPQRPMREEARMLRAWENVVRRGRARGLGMTMISQRSAAINKTVLTQIETLIVMRTTSPQDRKAIEAWVDYHGESKELVNSLPGLANGEAWVWSPSWLKIRKRIAIRKRQTFDSSATPKNVKGKRPAAMLADVNLEAIRGQMAETIERAKGEDPKELKKRIRELEFAVADGNLARSVEVREVPVVSHRAIEMLVAIGEAIVTCSQNLNRASGILAEVRDSAAIVASKPRTPKENAAIPKAPRSPHLETRANGDLSGGERKILTVLAQAGRPQSKRYVALRTGYAVNGGGFSNYISKLRSSGMIEGSKDALEITGKGIVELGDFVTLPNGVELRGYWMGELGRAESAALEAIAGAYPKSLTKERVAELAGYEPTGGGFNNALSRLRTLQLISGRGELRASDELFD